MNLKLLIAASIFLAAASQAMETETKPASIFDAPLSFLSEEAGMLTTPSYNPGIYPKSQYACEISLKASPIDNSPKELKQSVHLEAASILDERVQIKETSSWPNSVHGVIFSKFRNNAGYFWGTGTLIAPNIVVTAAQNLYSRDIHNGHVVGEATIVRFVPAMNSFNAPFDVSEVQHIYYPEEYKNNGSENFGIIILEQAPRYTEGVHGPGYFGIGILPDDKFDGHKLNVTGYPKDKFSKKNERQIWAMDGKATKIDQNLIHHNIYTAPGQIGAGLWYQDGNHHYVVGIHLGNGEATRLTTERFKQIIKWVNK
jgi:V8-like Glu-specific endopeptidase